MNNPTSKEFQLRRILITEISITQDSTACILYQVPFELTQSPSRTWKEILLNIWCSTTTKNSKFSGTAIWVFHNRILVNNLPIELVGTELETLVATTVDKTNNQMVMRSKLTI